MKKLLVCAVLAASLASCATVGTVDNTIADVNSKVYKYCVFLVSASAIAKMSLKDQVLADRIDAGVNEYCTNARAVTDVPTALLELSQIYREAVKAGVKSGL